MIQVEPPFTLSLRRKKEDLLAGAIGLKIVVSYLQVGTPRIIGTKTVFSYNL